MEKRSDTRRKIIKYWIPIILVILIIINLTIVPEYLSNPLRATRIAGESPKSEAQGNQAKPLETSPQVNPTETIPQTKPLETPQAKPLETSPQAKPTETPQANPVETPQAKPKETPQTQPTETPQAKPTETPQAKPTETPQAKQTETPQAKPTETPQAKPTETPQTKPTETPQTKPTETPQVKPIPPPKLEEPSSQKPVSPLPEQTSKKKKKKHLHPSNHTQSPSFRSSLFFYVIFLSGLLFSLISFKTNSDNNCKSQNDTNTNKAAYKSEDREYSYAEDNEEYDRL